MKTVRKSLRLPKEIAKAIEELAEVSAQDFEEAMAQMGADPAIRAECAAISRDFAITEADGVTDD